MSDADRCSKRPERDDAWVDPNLSLPAGKPSTAGEALLVASVLGIVFVGIVSGLLSRFAGSALITAIVLILLGVVAYRRHGATGCAVAFVVVASVVGLAVGSCALMFSKL